MHAAGIDEPIVDMESIKEFIEAGADVILMPAVNTVPGLSEQEVTEACRYIKAHGALSLSAIVQAKKVQMKEQFVKLL